MTRYKLIAVLVECDKDYQPLIPVLYSDEIPILAEDLDQAKRLVSKAINTHETRMHGLLETLQPRVGLKLVADKRLEKDEP